MTISVPFIFYTMQTTILWIADCCYLYENLVLHIHSRFVHGHSLKFKQYLMYFLHTVLFFFYLQLSCAIEWMIFILINYTKLQRRYTTYIHHFLINLLQTIKNQTRSFSEYKELIPIKKKKQRGQDYILIKVNLFYVACNVFNLSMNQNFILL